MHSYCGYKPQLQCPRSWWERRLAAALEHMSATVANRSYTQDHRDNHHLELPTYQTIDDLFCMVIPSHAIIMDALNSELCKKVPMPAIHIQDGWFCDEAGRRMLLRGVNLGGSNKVPTTPNGATHLPDSLDHTTDISFIGRPFPLEDADEHFARLRAWGFNVLRMLTTWEAIEHAGPGQYDTAYLDWYTEIVRRAGDYGFYVFIDPHQDVWGRWSGGDGAPHWTYTAVGLNPTTFDATEAAITMQRRYPHDYRPMIWASNTNRFAASTMFTLFFGGNDFTPHVHINGEPVQDFLQRHFIAAMCQLAERVRSMPHVIGFGGLNEASGGYIGWRLDENVLTPLAGLRISGFQGMVAASGYSVQVPFYRQIAMFQVLGGYQTINADHQTVWQAGASDIWREAGIWDIQNDIPILLKPEHFRLIDGRPVRFDEDYLKPFICTFAQHIRQFLPDAIMFVENEILRPTGMAWGDHELPNIANATHWYDGLTLFSKRYLPWLTLDVITRKISFGANGNQKAFIRQIGDIKQHSIRHMGNCPTLIGEFGVPYDLAGYELTPTSTFIPHIQALTNYYNALDANLVNATQWNYTADNDNQWGDQWNTEDLSIWSRSQQTNVNDVNSGARGLLGFCRPYARRTAGTPIHMRFDRESGLFELYYVCDPAGSEPTEIYVPRMQYPDGYTIDASSGRAVHDSDQQLVYVYSTQSGEQRITIRRR
ncbi:MAG: hypothetical protein GFH27_549413n36 [Chloroflexi bacterium AL-W]|nr:hypothetical protein [Chloroflexi bacterium AL-N1]NOK71434.1 hypothetical protein [Chloroflexi bacterium AL-N10]NOK78837.1 hypothetical protein [Chloroflexi bacterium AL-N5]NOK86255.1 hypothetical protein [Chloroflexi bacterium AL-W]NOK93159.1 hypothetical protein [Chloroflexi bacterium AL-N15]